MEVEIKQQFEIGFWFFNFCWYILNTYFNILFTYFIFWFLKQTAILFYFTNTNFVFCVHLSLLSPSLSLSLLHMYVRWFLKFRLILIFLRISVTFLSSRCLLKFLLPQFTVCVENICLSAFLSAFLFVFVCVCVYVHTYIYTYTYLYIHTYICNLLDLDLDLDLYRLLSYFSFSNRTTPLTCKLSVSICIIVALFHCFSFSILNTRIV